MEPVSMLDVEAVARQLGVSIGTVRNLVRDGELKAHRIRRQLRFKPADIEAYLEAQVVKPRTKETVPGQPDQED